MSYLFCIKSVSVLLFKRDFRFVLASVKWFLSCSDWAVDKFGHVNLSCNRK